VIDVVSVLREKELLAIWPTELGGDDPPLQPGDELLALLNDDPADIIVCGSTHVPFQRAVAEYHIVNVGSVGAAPEGQVAHYTVLTPRMSSADILQDWISYEEPEAS